MQDARREVEKKMYELQASNQQICLRLRHLQSSFDSVKQAFALLQRQAYHVPIMVASIVKGLQDEVCSKILFYCNLRSSLASVREHVLYSL